MPKPYSIDLRARVIEDVETGASRREAAERYGISPSVVVIWMQRFEETGRVAAKPNGGSTSPLEQHAEFLLGLIADQPDLTLDEIVAAMRKRRIPGSRSAVWRFFARRNISFKKNSVRGGAEACGRSPRSPALDGGASRPLPEREQERPRLSATRLSLHDIAHDDRFHLVGAKSIAGDCGAIATAPRFGAGTSLRLPPSVPIAVRTGSAKTTECCDVMTKPLEPWTA